MKIVFVGVTKFSYHCLNEVLRNGGNVIAVLTLPGEKASFHSDFADLSEITRRENIPLYRIESTKDPATIELVQGLKPDVIFVFGWSQIIPPEILDIPPKGCIGTHPALLPRNRGRHPLIWALVKGLNKSGLTFLYMNEGVDSGDILMQREFEITRDDDASTLYRKIEVLAAQMISEFLPLLEQDRAPKIRQDHSKANYWEKRGEKDGEIDWSKPTMETYNLIRALTHPYIGAHTFAGGVRLTVWKARLPDHTDTSAKIEDTCMGEVIDRTSEGLHVRTSDGYIILQKYEAESPVEITSGDKLGG